MLLYDKKKEVQSHIFLLFYHIFIPISTVVKSLTFPCALQKQTLSSRTACSSSMGQEIVTWLLMQN